MQSASFLQHGNAYQKLDSGRLFFRPRERVWYFTLCRVPQGVCSPGTNLCATPRALPLGGLLAFRGRWRELGADWTSLRVGDEPRACRSMAGLSLPLPIGGELPATSIFLFSFFQNTDLRRVRVPWKGLSLSASPAVTPALAVGSRRLSLLSRDSPVEGEGGLLWLPTWLLPFQLVPLWPSGRAGLSLSIEGITARGRSNFLGSRMS